MEQSIKLLKNPHKIKITF